jgi:Flp pilus assembly pilin Flp
MIAFLSTALKGFRAQTTAHTSDSQRGATAVEYAILASLIAVVIISGVIVFGDAVLGLFNSGASATSNIG